MLRFTCKVYMLTMSCNMTPGLEKAQDRARLVTIKLLYKSFGFFFTLALNIFINKNEYIKLLDKIFLKVV